MPEKQSSPSSQVQKEDPKKELIKPDAMKIELEEIKKYFSNPATYDQETRLVRDFYQIGQTKELSVDQKKEKKISAVQDLSMLYGLENGIWVATIDYEKYQSTIGQMRKKIIADYNCKTTSELMLADSIVASYWRIIKNERIVNRIVEKEDGGWSFDQLRVNIIKELNKEIDLANRRLNMNIVLLKEMKQPALKVNVRANNAFVGENQQFNNNVETNESK